MSVIGRLCCGKCHKVLNFKDDVVISDFYTVAHNNCFYKLPELEMDRGKFGYIVNKYFD